ncbi:hypothetical protein AYO20_03647 [Fonsecaea nubica]|uniref:Protein kinase domain-containing protein n=1 Tax=Fonsecaea nubica TaxID=856822 RepID=A0A178D4Z0_9EURO|nr:hypothetical protein AYO20_03647 [Fonsecaea nubica]OAL37169.1 hypothetical protein AYO20_03647 [Fonsecaea nubica]
MEDDKADGVRAREQDNWTPPTKSSASGHIVAEEALGSDLPQGYFTSIHFIATLNGTTVTDKVIGIGGTNIVLQRGEYAIKIPRLSRITQVGDTAVSIDQSRPPQEGDFDYRGVLIRALQNEKDIYRRIGPHEGVTPCYNVSSTPAALQMPLMGEDLHRHLAQNRPGRKTQLAWLRRLAGTLAHIHYPLSARDRGRCPSWDLEGPDALGYSILSDIGQLGAVMFLIVTGRTGRTCQFHLEDDNGDVAWPSRDSLPPTDDVWLGSVIEKCWTRGFKSAGHLALELEQVKDVE